MTTTPISKAKLELPKHHNARSMNANMINHLIGRSIKSVLVHLLTSFWTNY